MNSDELIFELDNAVVGGGTNNHAELENLDYENSGHTGFQPTGDYVEDPDYVHTDNNFTDEDKQRVNEIDDLEVEIDNLDANKVPTTRKINNKQLNQDITLTPSDIGIGSVFTLKGSVATIEQLPSTGNQIGDVYYVESEEVGYIWLEKQSVLQWEQLGLPIDLSNYYNKTQIDTKIGEINPILIKANTNVTVNGYQVPKLNAEDIQAIYNGIVAGKEVVVVDATETMHFKVNQADSVSDEIFISFLYFDIMILQYDENENITFKEIASKEYVDDIVGDIETLLEAI